MKLRVTILAAVLGALNAGQAHAITLWDAYFKALQNDPTYKVALADYKSGMEEGRIANAGLYPQISLSFYSGDSNLDRTVQTTQGPRSDTTDYSVKNNQLQLRQTIINMGAWAQARQGDLFQDQAQIKAIAGRNDLAIRVVKAYFAAVQALDLVELGKSQEAAAIERHKEIESALRAGEASRTDLARALAQRDLRTAERIEAQDNLDVLVRRLEDMVGIKVESLDLLKDSVSAPPLSTDFTFSGLQTQALRSNPNILSAALDVKITEEEVKKRQAGHYPTLDLIASKTDSDSESINTIGQKTKQDSLGLQLQVPLFSGFSVTAQTEKAKAQLERSEAVWQATVNEVLNSFKTQFARTQNAMVKIQAYERAVESARESLTAAQLGRKVDLQILSEVLTAQAELNNTEKEYSRVRYESYTALLELYSVVGRLQNSDLKSISDFFASSGTKVVLEREPLPKFEFLDPKKMDLPRFNPEVSRDGSNVADRPQ